MTPLSGGSATRVRHPHRTAPLRRRAAAVVVTALALGALGPLGAAPAVAVAVPSVVPSVAVTAAAAPVAPWPGLGVGRGTTARAADGRTWRLLVTGDSLSRGSNGDVTWRQRLYAELRRQGTQVVMVGPRTGSTTRNGAPVWWADAAFGRIDRHDALGGTTIAAQRPVVGARVAAARPDLVCVLLGLNDLRNGAAPATVVARMRAYLTEVLRARPRATVVLGPLMPTVSFPDGLARRGDTEAVNAGYADLVRRLRAGGYSARWADPAAAAWTPRTDSFDGTHPTARGETVLLRRFGAALDRAGVLPTTPRAVPATVPWLTQAVATPTVAGTTATLTWGPWMGRLSATRMLVRVTGPDGAAYDLVSGVGATSVQVPLAPGSYRVEIAPKRNWMEGTYGPARAFTVG